MEKKRHKTGSFVATARIAGKKEFFYSKLSQADADEQAASAKKASARPRSVGRALTERGTFAQFCYDTFCPRKYENLRKTSQARADSILRKHILPALGTLPIAEIGYDEFQTFKASLSRKDKREGELSPKSKREALLLAREILSLHRSLQQAKGLRSREDWKLVKLPDAPRKKQREEPEEDFTVRILEAARGTFMEGPLFCALFLGLRRGEVCGLMWKSIDRKKLRVSVSEQRHPLLQPGSPTKSDRRTIPILERMLEIIDRLGDKSSPYVFTMETVKGGRQRVPLMPNQVSKAMPALCDKAKLQRRTFHDLRAFSASNLSDIGADPITVMEILGHTKLDTTQLYLYGREKRKREAIEKALDKFLSA